MTPWPVACQAPLSLGFCRQDYLSRLLFPPPEDLPDPGIEPTSPTWQWKSLPLNHVLATFNSATMSIRVPVSFQISFCLFWIYVQEWKKFCHITLSDKWWNLLNLFIKYFREFSPEKAMATHSSTLAWKIPWMEEPGRLQATGSQWVGNDWSTYTFTSWVIMEIQ